MINLDNNKWATKTTDLPLSRWTTPIIDNRNNIKQNKACEVDY